MRQPFVTVRVLKTGASLHVPAECVATEHRPQKVEHRRDSAALQEPFSVRAS